MRRQVLISLILIGVLLGIGSAGAYLLIHTAPKAPVSDSDRPALLVRTRQLTPQTLVEPIVGYGTARADRYAWIAS